MRSAHRVGWGMAASTALHALLLVLLNRSAAPLLDQRPGAVMSARLVPQPAAKAPAATGQAEPDPATPEAPADSAAHDAPAEEASMAAAASAPVRTDIYYYFPEELDRQLIVLRDRSGDYEIALEREVVLHLFVDLRGKVAAIAFEGEPPAPAIEEQIRTAFMTMEFMPGVRKGAAVPSRLKIGIAAPPPIDSKVY